MVTNFKIEWIAGLVEVNPLLIHGGSKGGRRKPHLLSERLDVILSNGYDEEEIRKTYYAVSSKSKTVHLFLGDELKKIWKLSEKIHSLIPTNKGHFIATSVRGEHFLLSVSSSSSSSSERLTAGRAGRGRVLLETVTNKQEITSSFLSLLNSTKEEGGEEEEDTTCYSLCETEGLQQRRGLGAGETKGEGEGEGEVNDSFVFQCLEKPFFASLFGSERALKNEKVFIRGVSSGRLLFSSLSSSSLLIKRNEERQEKDKKEKENQVLLSLGQAIQNVIFTRIESPSSSSSASSTFGFGPPSASSSSSSSKLSNAMIVVGIRGKVMVLLMRSGGGVKRKEYQLPFDNRLISSSCTTPNTLFLSIEGSVYLVSLVSYSSFKPLSSHSSSSSSSSTSSSSSSTSKLRLPDVLVPHSLPLSKEWIRVASSPSFFSSSSKEGRGLLVCFSSRGKLTALKTPTISTLELENAKRRGTGRGSEEQIKFLLNSIATSTSKHSQLETIANSRNIELQRLNMAIHFVSDAMSPTSSLGSSHSLSASFNYPLVACSLSAVTRNDSSLSEPNTFLRVTIANTSQLSLTSNWFVFVQTGERNSEKQRMLKCEFLRKPVVFHFSSPLSCLSGSRWSVDIPLLLFSYQPFEATAFLYYSPTPLSQAELNLISTSSSSSSSPTFSGLERLSTPCFEIARRQFDFLDFTSVTVSTSSASSMENDSSLHNPLHECLLSPLHSALHSVQENFSSLSPSSPCPPSTSTNFHLNIQFSTGFPGPIPVPFDAKSLATSISALTALLFPSTKSSSSTSTPPASPSPIVLRTHTRESLQIRVQLKKISSISSTTDPTHYFQLQATCSSSMMSHFHLALLRRLERLYLKHSSSSSSFSSLMETSVLLKKLQELKTQVQSAVDRLDRLFQSRRQIRGGNGGNGIHYVPVISQIQETHQLLQVLRELFVKIRLLSSSTLW